MLHFFDHGFGSAHPTEARIRYDIVRLTVARKCPEITDGRAGRSNRRMITTQENHHIIVANHVRLFRVVVVNKLHPIAISGLGFVEIKFFQEIFFLG
jgi:hypothetical protein